MKLFEKLTDENFTMFAMQCYDNPQCTSMEEFMEDLRRFRYLKRLLRRYYKNGELRERLILNHLIVIFNIFGFDNSVKMLEFKIDDEYWPVLKTCLIYNFRYIGYSERHLTRSKIVFSTIRPQPINCNLGCHCSRKRITITILRIDTHVNRLPFR